MTAARVSPDGRYLAYALSEAGSDWRTIRVREVATGNDLPDELTWTKWVDPTWLPDESGFLYWRYPQPVGGEFTAAMGAGELLLHRLGADPVGDELIWSRPDAHEWMADPWVAADGRWLVFTSSPGTDSRSAVHARRLSVDAGGPKLPRRRMTSSWSANCPMRTTSSGTDGDILYLRTELDAPRGRLVAVDLDRPDAPGGAEIIAQHDTDVLVDARPAAGSFALLWSTDAAHRLEIVDRAGGSSRLAGTARTDFGDGVELPGPEQRDLCRRHVLHHAGQVVSAGSGIADPRADSTAAARR